MTTRVHHRSPRPRTLSPAAASAADESDPYKKIYPPSLRNRRPSSDPQGSPIKESDLWATGIYSSSTERVLRTIVGPILLLLATPIFVNIAALAAKQHDSDITTVWAAAGYSITTFLSDAFPIPSKHVVAAVTGFVVFQMALFILLPGKIFPGARAPSGFIPQVSQGCIISPTLSTHSVSVQAQRSGRLRCDGPCICALPLRADVSWRVHIR